MLQVPQTSYRLMPDLGSRLRLAVMDLLPAAWVHSYILRRYADASCQYFTHVRHVTAPEVSVVSLSLCQCPNTLKLLV